MQQSTSSTPGAEGRDKKRDVTLVAVRRPRGETGTGISLSGPIPYHDNRPLCPDSLCTDKLRYVTCDDKIFHVGLLRPESEPASEVRMLRFPQS